MRMPLFPVLFFIHHCRAIPSLIPNLGGLIPLEPPSTYTPELYPLLFPGANYVGAFLGPILKVLLGDETLENLDTTADFSCIAAGNDPSGKGGVCQRILAGLYKLAVAFSPVDQSAAYKELIEIACIAPNTQPPLGTCQAILELGDCTANRILVVKDLECNKGGVNDD